MRLLVSTSRQPTRRLFRPHDCSDLRHLIAGGRHLRGDEISEPRRPSPSTSTGRTSGTGPPSVCAMSHTCSTLNPPQLPRPVLDSAVRSLLGLVIVQVTGARIWIPPSSLLTRRPTPATFGTRRPASRPVISVPRGEQLGSTGSPERGRPVPPCSCVRRSQGRDRALPRPHARRCAMRARIRARAGRAVRIRGHRGG